MNTHCAQRMDLGVQITERVILALKNSIFHLILKFQIFLNSLIVINEVKNENKTEFF